MPTLAWTRMDRLRADETTDRSTTRATAYRADLDGLRAIAIGLVILTHARWPWPNDGGDAGVTAFFVLSGYLITGLLLAERSKVGRIDIGAFYRRRILRLGPALLGLIAFVIVYGLTIGWGPRDWSMGVLSCLAYVTNWADVTGVSVEPFAHAWSLSIEEQFYLVWPALLILLRGRILVVALALLLAGSLLRTVTSGPFEYFSTLTRADAIVLGCILAVVRPRAPSWVAILGVVALFAVAFVLPADHDVAIPIAMLASAAVIVGELQPLGRLAPLGLRAYSLYLWNWPMTILFGAPGVIAPLLTVLAGEVSFRLLERPVLHRGRRTRPAVAMPIVPRQAVAIPIVSSGGAIGGAGAAATVAATES